MKTTQLTTCALVLALVTTASPSTLYAWNVMGPGAVACSKASETLSSEEGKLAIWSWMFGYMSAYNLISDPSSEYHDLTGLTPDYLIRHFQEFCALNPDGNGTQATMFLLKKIPVKTMPPP